MTTKQLGSMAHGNKTTMGSFNSDMPMGSADNPRPMPDGGKPSGPHTIQLAKNAKDVGNASSNAIDPSAGDMSLNKNYGK